MVLRRLSGVVHQIKGWMTLINLLLITDEVFKWFGPVQVFTATPKLVKTINNLTKLRITANNTTWHTCAHFKFLKNRKLQYWLYWWNISCPGDLDAGPVGSLWTIRTAFWPWPLFPCTRMPSLGFFWSMVNRTALQMPCKVSWSESLFNKLI